MHCYDDKTCSVPRLRKFGLLNEVGDLSLLSDVALKAPAACTGVITRVLKHKLVFIETVAAGLRAAVRPQLH